MPLQWNSLDTRYAVLSAALPATAAIAGSFYVSKNENIVNFLKAQRFPSCIAPSCQYVYLTKNVVASTCFGYASYLVYKIGGGFDYTDTSAALGLYGTTVGMGLLALPFMRMNKPKWLFVQSILLSALSLATTIAFYKIDKISGLWTLPFSFLSLYYSTLWGKTVCCGGKTSTE
ncbi:hypothetical protein Mgra_00006766 [Meloidogyne graminicola]|uniref:Uncharacterized protein n=1 Tax=Meloidogyne graminicola TaxID=189291 RepID=A0A8S9ZKT4_9BILA|nr:hypothetical protein Mgra_00006766 [Meloidogyne graminicola]